MMNVYHYYIEHIASESCIDGIYQSDTKITTMDDYHAFKEYIVDHEGVLDRNHKNWAVKSLSFIGYSPEAMTESFTVNKLPDTE